MDAITYTRKVGFDKMISIGNMADVDFADLIEWLEEDENTACTCLYIEGIKDGRKFIEACRKAKKPIIALKAALPPTAPRRRLRIPGRWPDLPRYTMPLSSRPESFRLRI